MESLPRSTKRGRTFLLPCSYKNKRKRDMLGGNYRSVSGHISKLPDDILVNILSHLTMKEAVRASILSSRWRYLWRRFTGCLNFEDPLTMADLKWSNLNLKSEPLNVERRKFVSWVNEVLRSLEGHCIEELRICFDVGPYGNIDNWIKFAIERRVQRLELDLSRVDHNSRSVGQYNFTSNLDSYSSFKHLTALNLTTVAITGEVVEHILSYYCPAFEVLHVAESSILTSLKVSGSSLKLKHLKLESLNNLKVLELYAPNLLSFEYSGLAAISFRNVPNLVEVSFRGILSKRTVDSLRHHPSFPVPVGPLHTLKLDISFFYIYQASHFYNIPEFCNLKHLEIIGTPEIDCLLLCVAFLKACPSLFKFTLKLRYSCCESMKTIKGHPYLSFTEFRSVRVVELLGFVGHAAELEFVII